MTYMYTRFGMKFDLLHPTLETVKAEDIIWSLSRLPRFLGHTAEPAVYTVARHSVYMHTYSSNDAKPYALLHDAHEAYIGDIIRPVKLLIRTRTHKLEILQRSVQRAIHERFGLLWPTPLLIKSEIGELDDRLLAAEMRDLMNITAPSFDEQIEPANPIPQRVMPGNSTVHDANSLRIAMVMQFDAELFIGE